jgi:hypothetical protein
MLTENIMKEKDLTLTTEETKILGEYLLFGDSLEIGDRFYSSIGSRVHDFLDNGPPTSGFDLESYAKAIRELEKTANSEIIDIIKQCSDYTSVPYEEPKFASNDQGTSSAEEFGESEVLKKTGLKIFRVSKENYEHEIY